MIGLIALPSLANSWVTELHDLSQRINLDNSYFLIVLWALGLGIHIGGGLIHLFLVLAVIVIVVNLVRGRTG